MVWKMKLRRTEPKMAKDTNTDNRQYETETLVLPERKRDLGRQWGRTERQTDNI